ncbi:forkhead box protein N2b isoform X2 [Triplophysa rosa]|uniref:forkhead box protein N2b isoform X2 n=1 Tax=Triplophysa rosa TaxID=992332 RepID=UPI002545EF76|nr:forkhead box protein N2b isoform X2 [Triplophysa rosa]
MHEYPPGLMGPIIGMSPDKKAESPGAQGVCGGGTLPEADRASSPLATSLDQIGRAGTLSIAGGESEDDELTNLNWLHENLLQNFSLGGPEAQANNSPLFDIEGGGGSPNSNNTSSASSVSAGSAGDPYKSKPPFSFSLLIYMAIEQSPSKSLPVKDIYGWILKHFPYFSSAPTGWKNSVRHNLSLNKCFCKVERSIGKTNGKGSLWCVHPEFRPMLMQALRKQHFPNAHVFCTPPASPPSASSPPHHLFMSEQGCALKDDQDGPIDLSRRDVVVVSRDPKQDHNYSSTPTPPCPLQKPSHPLDFSLGLHHEQDKVGRGRWARSPLQGPLSGKRSRRDSRPEVDEELKEAAGSLLHLAGIRTSLVASRRKSRKLSRK